MHPRLDPACPEARELARKHADQSRLLVADPESQLANVIRVTQDKQRADHHASCTRCHAYEPRCPECRFDLTESRHGWMCHQQDARWMDVLPWNWRSRYAPEEPPSATSAPAGTNARRVPIGVASTVATVAPAGGARAPNPAATPVVRQAAKPRPKPSAPKPDALQLAYQSLGVSPSATDEEVRAAYRAKAQQYHPDKVATMAPEFRALAEQKMTELNNAYERVKRAR